MTLFTAMFAASTAAVWPSYRDAFETSREVSSQMSVWNSKIAWSRPCENSGWYGVYAVENSDREMMCLTTEGMR